MRNSHKNSPEFIPKETTEVNQKDSRNHPTTLRETHQNHWDTRNHSKRHHTSLKETLQITKKSSQQTIELTQRDTQNHIQRYQKTRTKIQEIIDIQWFTRRLVSQRHSLKKTFTQRDIHSKRHSLKETFTQRDMHSKRHSLKETLTQRDTGKHKEPREITCRTPDLTLTFDPPVETHHELWKHHSNHMKTKQTTHYSSFSPISAQRTPESNARPTHVRHDKRPTYHRNAKNTHATNHSLNPCSKHQNNHHVARAIG